MVSGVLFVPAKETVNPGSRLDVAGFLGEIGGFTWIS
jgi:hypothetical protein